MKKNDDYTSGRLQVSIFKKYWPLFWWNGIQIWITVHKQDVAPFSFLSGKKPTVDDQCNALFSCQMFILYAACKYIGFRRKRTEAYMLQSAFFILCDWFFRQKLHTILKESKFFRKKLYLLKSQWIVSWKEKLLKTRHHSQFFPTLNIDLEFPAFLINPR